MDVFSGHGIEVALSSPDDFLKVRETLTRIGIASRKEKKLYQSCHILHKRGQYAIIHFKELFSLDGKPTNFTDDDAARRNSIVKLLVDWGLVSLTNLGQEKMNKGIMCSMNQIKVISHKEKQDWGLVSKYNIGKKRKSISNNENYNYED